MNVVLSTSWQTLGRRLWPPFGERRFWLVQLMVVGLAGLHLALDIALSPSMPHAVPAGMPVVLLIVPISYAALNFGLAGSLSTGLWATVLWLPDLLLPGGDGHVGNDAIELAIVVAVAVFLGRHIEAEHAARSRAEVAEGEYRAAEIRVRRYAGLLLGAQEEERRRLAQELHDEPLQVLVYLARELERLEEASDMTQDMATSLEHVRQKTIDTMVDLRAVVQGLRPPAIERHGLVAALRGFSAEVMDESNLPCELRITGAERRLTSDVELGLFRIAQESSHNAIRHAKARQLVMTLDFRPNLVRLKVHDDGQGFDFESLDMHVAESSEVHFGIVGMCERARLIGGSLEIRSVIGSGTTVLATVPTEPVAVRPASGYGPLGGTP